MDGQIPTPTNIAQPEQTPKKGLLFEILFVVIVLVLVFGALNYFNILKLSEIFPNQLGFLPKRDVPTGTSQQPSNVTIAPTDQAKQTLVNFLPTILSPSLLPQSSSDIALIPEKENNKFSSPLNSKEGSGKITLSVSSDGKQIYELLLFFPYATSDSASIQLAEQITPQFFLIELKGAWGCKLLPSKANYCENFWTDANGIKRGVGIQEQNPIIKNQDKLFLFFCEHRKESSIYSWESCASEFAESGVQ